MNYRLICHLILYFADGAELRARLSDSVVAYKALGWSDGTKRTYQSQLSCLQAFCDLLGLDPVPLSEENVCLYIVYLADIKLFKYCTIVNYLNIIKHLHKSNGFQEPISGSWHIKQVLNGVKRYKGDAQKGATVITPELLLTIKKGLNLNKKDDICIWCACLVGFYGLLRPGNFLKSGKYVANRDIQLRDVTYHKDGYVLNLHWSKTVQFRERQLKIVLPSIFGHPLCPATAVKELLLYHTCQGTKDNTPFLLNLSYKLFIERINSILLCSGFTDKITGHSFRRGGATWYLKIGVSDSLIKEIGMWKSDAYLRYTEVDIAKKFEVTHSFGLSLPTK